MRINTLSPILFSGKRENDREFKRLKQQISDEITPLYYNSSVAEWDFSANSTDENQSKQLAANKRITDYFSNETLYQKLLRIKKSGGVSNSKDKKRLDKLIKEFSENISLKSELTSLKADESSIFKKLNSYEKTIDGRPVSNAEISRIIDNEKDIELRKKAKKANSTQGDIVADDIISLVKKRNEFAKKLGYSNYYDYMLQTSYDISPDELAKLFENVYAQIKDKNSKINEKDIRKIAKAFGISPDEVRDYHYGIILEGSPTKAINKSIKSKEQVVDFCKRIYKKMGYDIDKLPIGFDLFQRKNKEGGAFCSDFGPNTTTKILANLEANTESIETFMHELGHAVFNVFNNPKHYRFEWHPTNTMTEAIALMMGGLPATEGLFKGMVSDKTNSKYQRRSIEYDINSVISLLRYSDFERQMYLNPNQDLQKLWRALNTKYYSMSKNEELTNYWATIPHYTGWPAYCQNYFRSELIRAQLYEELTKRFGKISENPKVANFLNENIFQYGGTKEDNEILEAITGKKLEPDTFTKKAISYKVR